MVTTTCTNDEATLSIKEDVQSILNAYRDGLTTPQERDDLTVKLYFEWVGKIGRKAADPGFEQLGALFTVTTQVHWRAVFGA